MADAPLTLLSSEDTPDCPLCGDNLKVHRVAGKWHCNTCHGHPIESLPTGHLYHALNNMLSHIGFEGSIDADHRFVWDTMTALKAIDGGVYLDNISVPAEYTKDWFSKCETLPAALPTPGITERAKIAALKHAHELLARMGYHRDGEYFVHVNRAGAEAMHTSTVATIAGAALIGAHGITTHKDAP